jgi:hypothetical protein
MVYGLQGNADLKKHKKTALKKGGFFCEMMV